VNHRQKDWPEWLASAKFAINNKTYSTIKVSSFIANYGRELRMGVDIRRKGKNEESNRVCRKNEKGTERSRNSIEKSTRGNKVIDR